MAMYKNGSLLVQSQDQAFEVTHGPAEHVPHSGIYRCDGCGREVVAEQARAFPPQNHHQHSTAQGAVRWHLLVYADHNPKSA